MDKIRTDTIYLHLTKRCNLECVYCYFDAGEISGDEFIDEELAALAENIREFAPRRVIITGGEPLMQHRLLDFALMLRENDSKILLGLSTNGTLITNQNAAQVVDTFDEIRISIDGPKAINDALRGQFSFEKVIHALKCILREGGDPVVFITATEINLPFLKGFLGFLADLGVSKFHISPLKNIGRAIGKNMQCNPDMVKNAVQEFWEERYGLELLSNDSSQQTCGLGHYLSIHPDGSVYPCHVLAYPEFCIGNIKTNKLISIVESSNIYNQLRLLSSDTVSNLEPCFPGISQSKTCLDAYIHQIANRKTLSDVCLK